MKRRHNKTITTLPKRAKRTYSNLLHIRADTRTSFVNEEGEEVSLKTAVVLDKRKVTLTSELKLDFSYEEIPSDRPITVTEVSSNGSPLKGETPGHTQMYRTEKASFLTLFTNSEKLAQNASGTPLRELPINTNFMTLSPFNNVHLNVEDYSTHSMTINAAQLNKVKQELAVTGKSRNQNKVMAKAGIPAQKAAATTYATAAQMNEANISWEWLHKIAFRFLGREGQVPDNLVCGTAYANTDMLIIESALPQLTDLFPEGFLLTVHTQYMRSTKIVTKIDYIVTIDGNEFKASFNGQRQHKPLKVGAEYHTQFFKKLATDQSIDAPDLENQFPALPSP